MSAAANQLSDSGHWPAGPTGPEVKCDPGLLKTIRARVQEAFLSVPKGGVEVGGILFGTRSPTLVTIAAQRELNIDYATGPSFVLSPADEDRLRELLVDAADDPELAGLAPIGWYASHTRSALELNARDHEFFDRFFPGAGQIALLIKPFKFEPAQFSFFLRDASGSATGGAVFLLEETAPKRPAPAVTRPEESTAPSASVAVLAPPSYAVQNSSSEVVHYEPAMPVAAPVDRRNRFLLPTLAAAAAIVLAAFFWAQQPKPREFDPVALRISPAGDEVNIEWDGTSDRVQQAQSAQMWISDGSSTTRHEFTPEQLRQGRLSYKPGGGPLEVRMRFHGNGTEGAEQFAYFAVPKPTAPAETAAEAREMARMKAEVERLNERLRQMEQPSQSDPLARREVPATRPAPASVSTPTTAAPAVQTAANRPLSPASQLSGTRSREAAAQLPETAAPRVAAPVQATPPASTPPLPSQQTSQPTAQPASAQVASNQPAGSRTPPLSNPPSQQQQPAASTAPAAVQQPAPVTVARSVPPPSRTPLVPARRSGRAIWTGELRGGDVLIIDDKRPSAGTLTGDWFKGPARVRVFPGELAAGGVVVYSPDDRHKNMENVESPSEKNGWNVTSYKWDRKRGQSINIMQSPSAANNRLMIRNAGKTVPLLFIEWETLPEAAQ